MTNYFKYCLDRFLFGLICCGPFFASGQSKQEPTPIAGILKPVYSPGWLLLQDSIQISTEKFISDYKAVLLPNDDDQLKIIATDKDDYGLTHSRYVILHKGYEVADMQIIFHTRGAKLVSVNGNLQMQLAGNISINLTRQQAIEKAKLFFPAQRYAWENPAREKDKKDMLHDTKATYYPEAKLMWQKKQSADTNYYLCYSVDIVSDSLQAKRIFINAVTGTVIDNYPLSTNCVPTSVSTIFYGARTINTKSSNAPNNGTQYSLWDDCTPAFIRTRKISGDTTDYINDNNSWSNEISAVTSQWGVKEAYNYFKNIHGRQSWNNANGGNYVYQLPGVTNAYSLTGNLQFGESGAAGISDDYNPFDVVVHEFTHGVTETSARLVYEKESGALNESFSDIFGVSSYVNFFGTNTNMWKRGYDRINVVDGVSHLYSRNMANPQAGGTNPNSSQPDSYKGTFWYNTDSISGGSDNWGVHRNSGVQNYMYYLLVTGGTGTNDFNHAYAVSGIGFVDARRIAYQALTAYLSANSTHVNARNAWVQAAKDIFGDCSNQCIQTGKAWDAVGLPPPDQTFNYVGNYTTTATFNVRGSANLAYPSAMTIQPNASITVRGKVVKMLPGFKAFSGSYFRAYYGDCFYTAL